MKMRYKDKNFKDNRFIVRSGTKAMTFEQIHKGCVDKTVFHARKTVRKAARELNMRYYKCEFCGNWHLTRSKGSLKP